MRLCYIALQNGYQLLCCHRCYPVGTMNDSKGHMHLIHVTWQRVELPVYPNRNNGPPFSSEPLLHNYTVAIGKGSRMYEADTFTPAFAKRSP